MPSWRERVLERFVPQVARLWVATDPDGMLLEEGLVQELQAQGFEVLSFDDPVAFRYAYESAYRSRWDRGDQPGRSVILRLASDDLRTLPFDLLTAGHRVNLGLGEMLPGLDHGVISGLDRGDLDELDQAVRTHAPSALGENGTKDFALRHVFHVDAEQITTSVDLLRTLLVLHTSTRPLPDVLAQHLIDRVPTGRFTSWPIRQLITDRSAFLRFLQERWPHFVGQWIAQATQSATPGVARTIAETRAQYEVDGPADLPLGHDQVRPYVDTLFLEGLLTPIEQPRSNALHQDRVGVGWMSVGIRSDPTAERARRLDRLLGVIAESGPGTDARYHEWLAFARTWSELTVLRCQVGVPGAEQVDGRFADLCERVDDAFLGWVHRRYSALYSQSGTEPVMVHHIPRAMARRLETSEGARVALLVLDGLALDQWIVLRDVVIGQRPDLVLHEGAVFAWVPTITSVSRQATFAGKPPMQFPNSIRTTSREEALWRQFWNDNGLSANEVRYLKGLGSPGTLGGVKDLLSLPRLQAIGLVVDTVDEIMHGMKLGTAGMHNQVSQWAKQEFMANLLDCLLDAGFDIFLTADHGNIEAIGCGNPAEAALAVSRGERVRTFADPTLRAQVKARFPHAIEWSPAGLPTDYLPLLAPDRTAFIQHGERRVSHGGVTVEEVIVPFVRIDRGTA